MVLSPHTHTERDEDACVGCCSENSRERERDRHAEPTTHPRLTDWRTTTFGTRAPLANCGVCHYHSAECALITMPVCVCVCAD